MDNKTLKDFEENDTLDIEKIIDNYNAYIYTILKNSLKNNEDIEEILSDVFTILWKNYNHLDKNIQVKPYLIGISKNLIRKKYRISNINFKIENIDDYENEVSSFVDIQNIIERKEKSKIISDIIDNMKQDEKQIFIMFYYKSQKIKEISKEFNISVSKVKITLHRLRKLIKKKLKERGYSYEK